MMDFVSAMRIVEAKGYVRRKGWPRKDGTSHIGMDDEGLYHRTNFPEEGFSVTGNPGFDLEDYLAKDWLVARINPKAVPKPNPELQRRLGIGIR